MPWIDVKGYMRWRRYAMISALVSGFFMSGVITLGVHGHLVPAVLAGLAFVISVSVWFLCRRRADKALGL